MAGHRQAVNTIPPVPNAIWKFGKMTGLGEAGVRGHTAETLQLVAVWGREKPLPREKVGAQSSDLQTLSLLYPSWSVRGLHPPRVPAD